MMLLIAIALTAAQACYGVTVTLKPYNMSQEIGKNVTMGCLVTGKTASENVQWKFKANGSDTFNALTFNENVVGTATKYVVASTYNLTIVGVATTDEGTYRCSAGTKDFDATLTAVDLPHSMSISWGADPSSGTTVNLTCRAEYGRPPPSLRWTVGGKDMTSRAITETSTLTSTGYGDMTSYLPLYVQSSLRGQLAECQATYEGWDNAMNTTYAININGSMSLKMSGLVLTLITVLVTLM